MLLLILAGLKGLLAARFLLYSVANLVQHPKTAKMVHVDYLIDKFAIKLSS
nr:MAG TPA: hypothetical protein [Caudoviricetes sp.]